MRLLLHATIATAPLLTPLTEGWVTGDIPFELRASLTAAEIGPADAALIPSAEIAALTETHVVVPSVAVVQERMGTIAMRVPVRPDEVERTPVRLFDCSGTAEILARATIEPFYGIPVSAWVRGDAADAQVVVVEGAEALTAPEAGFAEDLVRAWFILTGEPVVSHLLVVPIGADNSAVVNQMTQVNGVAHERRRDARKLVAEQYEVDRDRLIELATATRFSLEEADRRALLMLLQRGNKGSAYPYPWFVDYLGEPPHPRTDTSV